MPDNMTRQRVADLLAQGKPRAEIARELGVSKATVSYHARRLGAPIDDRFGRRYDWVAVQRYYNDGYSVRECKARFGFSSYSWSDAVKRGRVVPRPSAMPLEDLLVRGVYRSRRNVKLRLLAAGLKTKRCERCGLVEWNGRPLAFALHHVNGDRDDHRLENLQLLCPNCHSQTDSFSGRNVRPNGTPAQ
jgi:hypothetical protein